MINFEKITNKNIWKVCTLEVNEKQKDYVADNIQSLAEAYATINEGNVALPFAIYNDDVLIGFVLIGKGTVGNPDEPAFIKDNYVLWRLMIDRKYQGKGYGKQTVIKVLKMMKNDEFGLGKTKMCWLSYEPENIFGKEFYHRLGFKENGEVCGGEIVAEYCF